MVGVECPRCESVRELLFQGLADWEQARERLCPPCAIEAQHHDVDEMAVERIISGVRINVTSAERREAVAYLTRSGRSARIIAERIGCSHRTVTRLRQRVN